MKKINIVRTICATFLVTSLTCSVTFAKNTEGVVNIESVPIVSSTNVDGKIIDVALKNEAIKVIDKVDRFYEVEYKGQKGYINQELIDITKTTGEVLDDNVRVLLSPENGSEIIGNVPKETNILIIDENEEFFEIEVQDKVGYVQKDLVFASIIETEDDLDKKIERINSRQVVDGLVAVVDVATLNLRAEPTTNADKLDKVSQGEVLEVIATLSEGWTEVLYNGQTAYVSSDFVKVMDEDDLPDLSDIRTEIVEFSKQYLGTPYVYGGTNLSSGVDCSGYMYSLYKNFDIYLSRSSRDQINDGVRIDKSELQPGDMVFFSYYGGSGVSHSGMYIGNNKFIHAASGSAYKVIISDLNEEYYLNNYYGASRVIS